MIAGRRNLHQQRMSLLIFMKENQLQLVYEESLLPPFEFNTPCLYTDNFSWTQCFDPL
ncbi:hypothetical protein Pgy4_13801 [Pseudomonas savastanoi pv. glycinea str. race 4]|uniref:Uncharacterized protein n=1 Tax=Pseudomonas savastanoi pv. glycinea str. race 4 TaxID=875330 RepID=E7PNC7_PSESG|nr:hypothetical protein PsgRace4_16374 [Pseudomonas savastanoi pv. glycinea str. race 4]EGH13189.1 hypothetical protein Pgy4_13801 [Pseudomonas savastanoi pv. glycinea str. race 4]